MHTPIRKTIYTVHNMTVSLPFIPSLRDEHPEAVEGAPPPAPPPPAKERRGPRPGRVTHQHLTDKLIRSVLNKPKPPRPGQAKYEATMKRVMREGW